MDAPPGKKSFWDFNIGHLITITGMVLLGLGAWYTALGKIQKLEEHDEQRGVEMKRITETLERINREGTTGSQRGIYMDTQLTTNNSARIGRIEENFTAFQNNFQNVVLPKLERIDVNMGWMMENLRQRPLQDTNPPGTTRTPRRP